MTKNTKNIGIPNKPKIGFIYKGEKYEEDVLARIIMKILSFLAETYKEDFYNKIKSSEFSRWFNKNKSNFKKAQFAKQIECTDIFYVQNHGKEENHLNILRGIISLFEEDTLEIIYDKDPILVPKIIKNIKSKGVIYIDFNERHPSVRKIGRTKYTADIRAKELTRPTGVLGTWTPESEFLSEYVVIAEKRIKIYLREYHIDNPKKEFYESNDWKKLTIEVGTIVKLTDMELSRY